MDKHNIIYGVMYCFISHSTSITQHLKSYCLWVCVFISFIFVCFHLKILNKLKWKYIFSPGAVYAWETLKSNRSYCRSHHANTCFILIAFIIGCTPTQVVHFVDAQSSPPLNFVIPHHHHQYQSHRVVLLHRLYQ